MSELTLAQERAAAAERRRVALEEVLSRGVAGPSRGPRTDFKGPKHDRECPCGTRFRPKFPQEKYCAECRSKRGRNGRLKK